MTVYTPQYTDRDLGKNRTDRCTAPYHGPAPDQGESAGADREAEDLHRGLADLFVSRGPALPGAAPVPRRPPAGPCPRGPSAHDLVPGLLAVVHRNDDEGRPLFHRDERRDPPIREPRPEPECAGHGDRDEHDTGTDPKLVRCGIEA